MRNSFETTVKQVRGIGEKATLLSVVNRHQNGELLKLSAAELDEYTEEREKEGSPSYQPMEAAGELHDAGVFFLTYLIFHHPDLLTDDPIGRVNGYGKRSDSVERLQEVILDAKDYPDSAILEGIARMYSIANYGPHPGTGLEYMERTVAKVLGNRPPYLYSIFCPIQGRKLNPDEAKLKHQHLELGTRMIRNAIGRDMKRNDWWPHRDLLLDWRRSRENLSTLNEKLEKMDKQPNKNEVVIFQN